MDFNLFRKFLTGAALLVGAWAVAASLLYAISGTIPWIRIASALWMILGVAALQLQTAITSKESKEMIVGIVVISLIVGGVPQLIAAMKTGSLFYGWFAAFSILGLLYAHRQRRGIRR